MSTNATFNESDHPRGDGGRFAVKGSADSDASLDALDEEDLAREAARDVNRRLALATSRLNAMFMGAWADEVSRRAPAVTSFRLSVADDGLVEVADAATDPSATSAQVSSSLRALDALSMEIDPDQVDEGDRVVVADRAAPADMLLTLATASERASLARADARMRAGEAADRIRSVTDEHLTAVWEDDRVVVFAGIGLDCPQAQAEVGDLGYGDVEALNSALSQGWGLIDAYEAEKAHGNVR